MEVPGSPETAEFEALRGRLFGVAYRMLGSRADAEDVVQEAYVRWHEADRAAIRNPEAWLVTAATRLAIDRLRRLKTEREAYVGPWLGLRDKFWHEKRTLQVLTVNGEAGLCVRDDGRVTAVMSFETHGDRIAAVYAIVNPDKLASVLH